MSVLKIIKYPDSRLKIVGKPIKKITSKIQKYLDDMVETMNFYNGIGISATQVGIFYRMFVMKTYLSGKKKIFYFINPEIIEKNGSSIENEGCLSFPNFFLKIKRWNFIRIKARNYNGDKFQVEYENNYEARCVQHEIDHLNGITFIDNISFLKKKMIAKKIKKYIQQRNTLKL